MIHQGTWYIAFPTTHFQKTKHWTFCMSQTTIWVVTLYGERFPVASVQITISFTISNVLHSSCHSPGWKNWNKIKIYMTLILPDFMKSVWNLITFWSISKRASKITLRNKNTNISKYESMNSYDKKIEKESSYVTTKISKTDFNNI